MKKLIWACIALLPFSVSAANKWLYGHGPNEHYSHYSDRFLAPEPDPAEEYRDPASAPGSDNDYDNKNEEADPRDVVFDRGEFNTTVPGDWENSPDRPSDWDQ